MMKFLGMVAGVVAALGLVAAPVMAAQADLLSDAQLAGIWAASAPDVDVDIDDVALAGEDNAANNGSGIVDDASDSNVANEDSIAVNADIDDVAIAGTDAASGGSNIDSNNDSSTDVDVDVDVDDVALAGENAASGGSEITQDSISDNNTEIAVEDVALAGENAASGGSTAAENLVQQNVQDSQNSANGVALSNSLLSQIAQQSNVAAVDTSTHSVTVNITQVNQAAF